MRTPDQSIETYPYTNGEQTRHTKVLFASPFLLLHLKRLLFFRFYLSNQAKSAVSKQYNFCEQHNINLNKKTIGGKYFFFNFQIKNGNSCDKKNF